jgi:curved DNA-binding protein CbpA
MKSVEDYCSVLGVDVNATPEQIKQAYRDLVKIWHPDRFAHDTHLQLKAEAKLKEINEAYKQLQPLIDRKRAATRPSEIRRPNTGNERTKQRQSRPKPAPSRKPAAKTRSYRAATKIRELISESHLWRPSRVLGICLAMLLLFKTVSFIEGMRQETATSHTRDQFELPANLSQRNSMPSETEVQQLSDEMLNKMKHQRANTAKLLALHEEQQMTLQKNFELRRELYVRGRITKESLAEAERALTEAIVRVYEDRRWLAEADRAMEEHSATLQSRDGTQ